MSRIVPPMLSPARLAAALVLKGHCLRHGAFWFPALLRGRIAKCERPAGSGPAPDFEKAQRAMSVSLAPHDLDETIKTIINHSISIPYVKCRVGASSTAQLLAPAIVGVF